MKQKLPQPRKYKKNKDKKYYGGNKKEEVIRLFDNDEIILFDELLSDPTKRDPILYDDNIRIAALEADGFNMDSLSRSARNDPFLGKIAIRQAAGSIIYLSKRLQKLLYHFARRKMIEQIFDDPDVFSFSSFFHDDKEIVILTLSLTVTPYVLSDVSKRLQDDEEVVLLAVQKYGHDLCFASDRLRNKFEIVSAAVINDKGAINCASDEMQEDPRIRELLLL